MPCLQQRSPSVFSQRSSKCGAVRRNRQYNLPQSYPMVATRSATWSWIQPRLYRMQNAKDKRISFAAPAAGRHSRGRTYRLRREANYKETGHRSFAIGWLAVHPSSQPFFDRVSFQGGFVQSYAQPRALWDKSISVAKLEWLGEKIVFTYQRADDIARQYAVWGCGASV